MVLRWHRCWRLLAALCVMLFLFIYLLESLATLGPAGRWAQAQQHRCHQSSIINHWS
jgi:hypothetical protein